VASQLLVSKASGETMARARLTGKHGDWQAPKNAYPNNWQQCPYRCEKKATQPAFILINESNKNTGPISTVILVGQHGRLDFDLKEPLGLYMLFEAALDSELAFQQKFRCPLATLPSMEMVRANMEAHHRLQRENERHFAHLIDAERAWLRRRNYKVQLKSRIRFLQSHLPRSGRSPRKPYRPSGLQYGLLSTVPAAFHFYTGQMENAAGFLPHPFKPKPSTTITLDGTPGCERDRVALRRMMTHTLSCFLHIRTLRCPWSCASYRRRYATLLHRMSKRALASFPLLSHQQHRENGAKTQKTKSTSSAVKTLPIALMCGCWLPATDERSGLSRSNDNKPSTSRRQLRR
jgi:hypothetical protein